ncbi:PIG-L family deacetylase [Citricoccus muralis]|uniref:4,4'-diaponeurosporenoate glycosyltransferase n=1 Tax=Citricoccus muralis TaxID=169134 RepID=A0ABY8H7V7_9MICC|nr:PIG-L family deacetylase [Citricoccus muralis]WFP16743.1 PIG-L family deacetylase [Citricoccus muralis]
MSFDHRDRGTTEEAWLDAGVAKLPTLSLPQLTSDSTVLVIVAHPDDETLGAAGLIRAALRRGSEVRLVVCTQGEGSHPESPTHTPAALARLRRQELCDAVEVLGEGLSGRLSSTMLSLPDGGLPAVPEEVQAAVAEAVAEAQTDEGELLVVTHFHRDGHGDHEAVASAVLRVAAERALPVYEFPLWYWHWADPQGLGVNDAWRGFARFPVSSDDQRARRAALQAYRSQVTPLSDNPGDEAVVTGAIVEHCDRPFETYLVTGSENPGSQRARWIFDRVHTSADDPWRYLDSDYEARKRALTLAQLPWPRYRRVVEVGCSIGVLTAELALRADDVTGLDASGVAVERARHRVRGLSGVRVEQAIVPDEWPARLNGPDAVDLAVVSEVGYFLSAAELDRLVARLDSALTLSGQILLCHWRHPVSGWPLDGDAVHARLRSDPRFRVINEYRDDDVVIDVFARAVGAEQALVVVPARDEQALLPGCLDALTLALDRFEALHAQGSARAVVTVDGSADRTLQIARDRAEADARFHVVSLDPGAAGGVGRARARGIDTAATWFDADARLWVVCTDADSRVAPEWLASHVVLAEGADAVLGTVALDLDSEEQSWRQRWEDEYRKKIISGGLRDVEEHHHIHGANLGVSWAAYQRVGGFSEVDCDEDVQLVERLRRSSARVRSSTRIPVITSDRYEGRAPRGFATDLRKLIGEGAAEGS